MENQKNKNQKKVVVISAITLVVLIAAMTALYFGLRQTAQEGIKQISFIVLFADETTKEYSIKTDKETLGEALRDEGLIEGTESEYGLMVTSVAGVKADDSKKQWWRFDKDGEMLSTGVDSTMIADGDKYEAVLTTY